MKRITLITLGFSIAACASEPPATSPPTAEDYDDTAQAIAASTMSGNGAGVSAGEVVAMTSSVSLARGELPLGLSRRADGGVHGNLMGVEHSFTITCKDAAGATLAKCDKTTDSATVEVTLTGSLETPNLTASIDRHGSWTIAGLQSDTATFNGSSSLALDTTLTSVLHQGASATVSFDATAAFDAVTISTTDRKITGGSASFEVKGQRTVTGTAHDVDRSFDVTAALTFNADGTATLVLDGTQTFTIDLHSGHLARRH